MPLRIALIAGLAVVALMLIRESVTAAAGDSAGLVGPTGAIGASGQLGNTGVAPGIPEER